MFKMPNQNNFRSDVTTPTVPTYLASRIVRVPTESILLEELPGSFGFDNEDNLEIHFYTIPDNRLVLSTIIQLSDDILRGHTVAYQDGTYKNYLRIDFTKLFVDKALVLIPGDYRMVVNFFSDEIGNYYNRKLTITDISPSRTEVELQFNDTVDEVTYQQNIDLLREFVEKSFIKADAVGVCDKIFKSGVELQDSTEGITADNIITNIDLTVIGVDQTFENTIARIERINLRPIFEQQINDFLLILNNFIREKIIEKGDERIQEDEFIEFVEQVLQQQIGKLQQTVDSRIKVDSRFRIRN